MTIPSPRSSTGYDDSGARMTNSMFQASGRCSQCNPRQRMNSRNIVVCIDGTSNQFGQNNTNVVKLFAKIDLETDQPRQFAYYSSGIGTRPKSLHIFNRMERAFSDKFDMAVAWNMEEIVKDAYGWLARTYQDGDQIYLFGFSRGAYQVRVLAGMIHEVGLIRTPTEKQIGTAWDHYESIRSRKPKTRQIAREFKNTFSWKELRVHFVGVWDTVSSVGLIRGDVFLSTSSSAAHACHFRHALALDELRVKFMPEYFHEMNSQTEDGKSKYAVSEHSDSTDSSTSTSETKKTRTSEIKEVWFAGSHSDVGGKNRPGKSHQAGNVSLLWMRREAAAGGLKLKPTDIVWVPDDLDFGISNSMTGGWKAIEYIPIKHQVSFSGPGEDARKLHRLQPRRIVPGQKVHASVLFANAYRPQATLGEGFDIPFIQSVSSDMPLDTGFWDTGLFDDTAAQELVAYLGGQQGVAPIYLDRLLFMLRFKEGKQCVRNVDDWQSKFKNLIENPHCPQLVRLVTIVAYYEASCDDGINPSSHTNNIQFPQGIFDDAKKCLTDILNKHKHRDCPRVVALLRPLTKHQVLRDRILTEDVMQTLMKLLDTFVRQPGPYFSQAMDGVNCLLECEDRRAELIRQLGANPPGSDRSRLSRMLEAEHPHHLIASLRVMMTLARIPDARPICADVKPRLRELAGKDKPLIGLLAVEALLSLYDSNQPERLNLRDTNIRTNLANALVRLGSGNDGGSSENQSTPGTNPGQNVLRQLFGLDAQTLQVPQQKLIRELKKAVQKGNPRERTAATMTILKLCETDIVRTYLGEIGILDVLIDQLKRKDASLLAAYALATCLKYDDMKQAVNNNDLPKFIVHMLRLDYFDDAVGQVEGFQIFYDFMKHEDLREKIKDYNITQVLETKLGAGKSKEIRTSLICLDIFRSFDENGPWTQQLVEKSLEHLGTQEWKAQKAGVTILSALAQTDHGVRAISPHIPEIVEMLLPEGYLLIQPNRSEPTTQNPASPTEQPRSPGTESSRTPPSPTGSGDLPPRPPSWMLGPACALRSLAQNKTLRDCTRETTQFGSLKHLFLSGNLVDDADTSAWRINTPNRADVIDMLDKMIKAVDEELSEEGLMSIGDAVLPHIQHWDRLGALIRNQVVAVVTVLPVLLGVSVLAVLAVVLVTPVYLSLRVYAFFKRLLSAYQNIRVLDRLLRGDEESDQGEGSPADDDVVAPQPEGAHEGAILQGGGAGEGNHGDEVPDSNSN